jgi:hypothetical protein
MFRIAACLTRADRDRFARELPEARRFADRRAAAQVGGLDIRMPDLIQTAGQREKSAACVSRMFSLY